MSFRDFVKKSKNVYGERGPRVLPAIFKDFVVRASSRFPYVTRIGRNIFEENWDVMLVLDACRWDMYDEIINSGERVWSVGSSSPEWMKHTFTADYEEELANTVYVSGNPFSEDHGDKFGYHDPVWDHSWDDDRGTVLPREITDRVIEYHREGDFDRILAHYMQPHYPFLSREGGPSMDQQTFGEVGEDDLGYWEQFQFGFRDDLAELREAYWDNLRYVWEDVEIVLDNVDGEVVITADHGNAMGEWGIWGHKTGVLHPKKRRVPWDRRRCEDSEEYVPEVETRTVEGVVHDRLSQLGYKQ